MQPCASMGEAYKGLPPDVLYNMQFLKMDTDEQGNLKFASFSNEVER